MRVRYTATALIEIDKIFSYIAEHSRSAAISVRERIERTVELLGEIPEWRRSLMNQERAACRSDHILS